MKLSKLNIVLWILTVFMALGCIAFFPHPSSFLMLIFAAICVPLPMVRNFWRKKGLYGVLKGLLLVVLFFTSLLLAPTDTTEHPQQPDASLSDTQDQEQQTDQDKINQTDPMPAQPLPNDTQTPPPPENTTNTEKIDTAQQPEDTTTQQPEDQSAQQPETPSDQQSENNNTTPSNGGNGNADNFNTYDNPDQQDTSYNWVLNTSSMKIHYPSCSAVKKIAPQNYATSNLAESELINRGYTKCGICH